MSSVSNVLLAAFDAIKKGIMLAIRKGWNKFFIVCNSQNAITALHNFPRY